MTRFLAVLAILSSIPTFAAPASDVLVGAVETRLAPGHRLHAAAATNGEEDFVVWADMRGGSQSLIGSRIRNGTVLDPLGIVIANAVNPDIRPHVVSIGNSWLAVWTANADGTERLMARRISREGVPLGPEKMLAEHAAGRGLAVIGTRAVAVFWRADGVHALVLDANANVHAHHPLADDDTTALNPAVAAGATQFLVVWERASRLEGVRLSASGDRLDATPRDLGAGEQPALASDGSGFAVVARTPENWITRRIAPDLVPGPTFALTDTDGLERFHVIWTGSRYAAIALQARFRLYVAFLDADGASPPPRFLPWPQASFFDETLGIAVRGGELHITGVRMRRADDRGVVRSEFFDAATLAKTAPDLTLSWSGNEHAAPRVAFDGTNHLVVWSELDGVFATRVTPGGESLDGRGIALAGPVDSFWRYTPAVVFDGTQYVVAWGEVGPEARLVIRFVDPATAAVSDRLELDTFVIAPELTLGENMTLVSWVGLDFRVMIARLDTASRSISAPIQVATSATGVAAGWNGSEFLVAWEELGSVSPRIPQIPLRILGTRVTPSLGILDPSPLLLGQTSPFSIHENPRVASNGEEWVVAWDVGTIRARRITRNGVGMDDVEGVVIRDAEELLGLTWDGARYVFALNDELVWVTPNLGFAGASPLPSSGWASLTRAANGVSAVYTRQVWEAPYAGVQRTVLREAVRPMKRRAVR